MLLIRACSPDFVWLLFRSCRQANEYWQQGQHGWAERVLKQISKSMFTQSLEMQGHKSFSRLLSDLTRTLPQGALFYSQVRAWCHCRLCALWLACCFGVPHVLPRHA